MALQAPRVTQKCIQHIMLNSYLTFIQTDLTLAGSIVLFVAFSSPNFLYIYPNGDLRVFLDMPQTGLNLSEKGRSSVCLP